jgi:hypothetical protein
MATPHVAGALAAIFHANSKLSAFEARDAILDPASYDSVTDPLGSMTSTGGRLNLQKALTNPFLASPKLNNFPTVTGVSNVFANAGDTVNLTATASDPDGDPVRTVWQSPGFSVNTHWLLSWGLNQIFPAPTGDSLSFQAPSLARTVTAPYAISVSDGKGGGATEVAYTTILASANHGGAPSGNLSVSPASGPAGTIITVNNQAVDPDGGPVAWDIWVGGYGGASGLCCQTAPYSFPINGAGAFRISSQATDRELQLSNRNSTVVRIGGATGTPPIAAATFDKLSGETPLTVNVDMSASSDPDGTIQKYTIYCDYSGSGIAASGPTGSCNYTTPGTYWILLQVKDNDNLNDVVSAYAVVTPSAPSSSKSSASVTLSNMTQAYIGTTLAPTATTNPPGLAVTWTNAPQTNPGTYLVTATINDSNYQGSATGTFTITQVKATASVTLSNMTQTYTGNAVKPSATTSPAGLAIIWTNAPQTNPGTYSVTATVSDPNYVGSASGTFTIVASVPPTAPAVTITSPKGGNLTLGTVNIQASVTKGSNPIAHVDFSINGTVKCSVAAAPYSCSWKMPGANGKSYQLQAVVYDVTGLNGSSSIVTVTSTK